VEAQKQVEEGGRETTETADIKGKIVEYMWYLKKEGDAPSTIDTYARIIKGLRYKKGKSLRA